MENNHKCDKCDGPHETALCPYFPHAKDFNPDAKPPRFVNKTGIQHHTSFFSEYSGWQCCERRDENDPGCVFAEEVKHHPKGFMDWNSEGNYGKNWDCCFRDYRDDPGCTLGLHPSNDKK